jgi:hypothetical protein
MKRPAVRAGPAPPAPATGIDYIGLLDTAHDTRLAAGAMLRSVSPDRLRRGHAFDEVHLG